MRVYYNDSEPFVAAWLRNLIAAGHLPAGDVDERPIQEVKPDDLQAYTQCHFFAGIGGWPYALQLADWGERPVWTGSCPCQSLSGAGKRAGHADARHLWPDFYRLIAECHPPTVFGEQVASSLGREWLAGVRADLEGLGYACGAADLCAASCGAPHIRQRLYWVADTGMLGREPCEGNPGICLQYNGTGTAAVELGAEGASGGVAQSEHAERRAEHQANGEAHGGNGLGRSGDLGGLADAERGAAERERLDMGTTPSGPQGEAWERERLRLNPWAGCELIPCRDGKARRVEPGIFPLAHGIPNRLGTLRGSGNAISPPVAAAFVRAYLDAR